MSRGSLLEKNDFKSPMKFVFTLVRPPDYTHNRNCEIGVESCLEGVGSVLVAPPQETMDCCLKYN